MKTIEEIAQKTVEKFVKDRISKITTYEEKMQILNLEKLCINAINEAQQWMRLTDYKTTKTNRLNND